MQSVGQLQKSRNEANSAEAKLFLEVELGQHLRPMPPPDKSEEDILLFFKLYDPLKEELRYVGRLLVKNSGKPLDILPKLKEMAGFSSGEEIELYEEIKFEPYVMCELLDENITFRASELEDGDIICFQKSSLVGNTEKCCRPDVPSFLEHVHNCQSIDQCFQRLRLGALETARGLIDQGASPGQVCSIKLPTQRVVGDGDSVTDTQSSTPLPTGLSTSTVGTSMLTSLSLPFLKENSISATHIKIVDEIFRKHGDVLDKVQVPDPAFKAFFLERLASIVELFRSHTATSITAEVLGKLKNMIQSLACLGVKVGWLESYYQKAVSRNKYAQGQLRIEHLKKKMSTAENTLQVLKDQLVEAEKEISVVHMEIGNETVVAASILNPL